MRLDGILVLTVAVMGAVSAPVGGHGLTLAAHDLDKRSRSGVRLTPLGPPEEQREEKPKGCLWCLFPQKKPSRPWGQTSSPRERKYRGPTPQERTQQLLHLSEPPSAVAALGEFLASSSQGRASPRANRYGSQLRNREGRPDSFGTPPHGSPPSSTRPLSLFPVLRKSDSLPNLRLGTLRRRPKEKWMGIVEDRDVASSSSTPIQRRPEITVSDELAPLPFPPGRAMSPASRRPMFKSWSVDLGSLRRSSRQEEAPSAQLPAGMTEFNRASRAGLL